MNRRWYLQNIHKRLISKIYQEFKPLDTFKKSKKKKKKTSRVEALNRLFRFLQGKHTNTLEDAQYH